MASELFVFENSFFSDPFLSTIDNQHPHDHNSIFQTIQESPLDNYHDHEDNDDDAISLEQIASVLLSSSPSSSLLSSSSPPSNQLGKLSLYPTTTDFQNGSGSRLGLDTLEVKNEEWNVPFGNMYGYSNSYMPTSCLATAENEMKLMQRSYSSNCFGYSKPEILYQPCFDSFVESPNLENHVVNNNSHESSFCSSQMRKVCSTGDLQNNMKAIPNGSTLSSSPLSSERSFIEDAANNAKVGRYNAEERKGRIDRYRAKRTQRNFNKTIKYACRKTLADHRPRIRGRFARNDEAGEISKTTTSSAYPNQNGEDIWVNGAQEDEEGSCYKRASIFNSFNSTTQYQYQYQYHTY